MWMKKRGLWVPGGELHGIADRPHWITILIGGVSPALALAAVWISYHALQTSETTLKIGNRAYVALVSGRMQFSDYGTAIDDNSSEHQIVRMDLSASIYNAGNSPASTVSFKR